MQDNSLRRPRRVSPLGLPLALVSAAAFATSGVFGKALFQAGWTPAAAITARIGVAALALGVPAALAMRGRWHLLRRNLRTVALYGMTGVTGCQLFYFLAVERLSVGVALLLEYLSPVLLVLLSWVTTRRAPHPLTVGGTVAAMGGLALVLDVFGGVRLDPVGVAFGLAAAVCSAAYFLLAARDHDDALPPLALTGFGMIAGLVPVVLVSALQVLPFRWAATQVPLAGANVSVLVPILGMGVLAAAFAYATGVVSARHLGPRIASFVALSEVLFAVLFAWLFLGELPGPLQLAGGVLILLGVILVRLGATEPAAADVHPGPEAESAIDAVRPASPAT